MFRFSQQYFRTKRLQETIAEARRAVEKEKITARRWRRKNPSRRPEELLALWNETKQTNTKLFSEEMVRTMALFDGVSEANKTMRFGLEAPDAGIDLETVHDLLFNTFNLRVFELLATHYKLSKYSTELVTQKLVDQIFKPAQVKRSTSFGGAIVSNIPEGRTPLTRDER